MIRTAYTTIPFAHVRQSTDAGGDWRLRDWGYQSAIPSITAVILLCVLMAVFVWLKLDDPKGYPTVLLVAHLVGLLVPTVFNVVSTHYLLSRVRELRYCSSSTSVQFEHRRAWFDPETAEIPLSAIKVYVCPVRMSLMRTGPLAWSGWAAYVLIEDSRFVLCCLRRRDAVVDALNTAMPAEIRDLPRVFSEDVLKGSGFW